jgi:hypothetical protein
LLVRLLLNTLGSILENLVPLLRLCCTFVAHLLRRCCTFVAHFLRHRCAFAAPLLRLGDDEKGKIAADESHVLSSYEKRFFPNMAAALATALPGGSLDSS